MRRPDVGYSTTSRLKNAKIDAYRDVLRAFDHFIERMSAGRPFVIASHSQGSFHAQRLLGDRVDATPL